LLFDLHPKEHRKELFGRDSELEYLLEQLLAGNWVVVGGQREIGKTSLVKVAIRELKEKHGFKGAYVNLRGVRSLNALLTSLIPEMNSSRVKLDLSFSVNFIMGSAGIQVKRDAKAVSSLNELLNSVHEDLVIAFDEVQELSQASKQFLDILGNVFSSNSRVRFLFTGSYIGVTRILIDPPSTSPLHGRPPVILNLRPFNDNTSRVFLRKGMREIGVDFNGEEEVVKRLDGVVGWLTLFGNFYAVRKIGLEEALNFAESEGKKIMIGEFEHFLENKNNKIVYTTLMDVIKVANKWRDIKRGMEIAIGQIDDKELSLALDSLVGNNFIEKVGRGEYRIIDPLLRKIDYSKILKPRL